MSSLKQFIRNVRAAKTIADERAVVQKESAAIRSSFREESHDSNVRRNNVAKLLYLFTLGERTHFGQIECLKLLASPRFADKRLGYLGTMLLLDENQEVLTLVTNSLKNDLNHSNQYIVGLALVTLGNIASIEMSRDLFPEVETIVSSSNPYIRRKAALCAMRICRKVPDLQEHFLDKAKLLLNDRNHGVLLCGLTLVISLCEADEAEDGENGVVEVFRPIVPAMVKILKSLSTAGYTPEHDVNGISDPFLQVKILRLLRVLARGDLETSELITDNILAQIATNTDGSKNVGNSILYESVLTILDIEADSALRVLGVNILGKFLSNKDNNIRYVALNTLVKVVAIEPTAVQRHRNTILDCLRDPDISIRRRALDLSFTLINESNVRVLVRELLAFLEVADNEFKPTVTSQIGIAADRFAPSKRWHIDTMLRVLKLAGNYVKEQILSSFVRLIATTQELQPYSVRKLYTALKDDITQEGLTLASTWVIGEYGDALLKGGNEIEDEEVISPPKESDIVDLLETILSSSYAGQVVTQYIITAAMKLTTRFKIQSQIDRINRLLFQNQTNLDIEIQQRAVEYTNLFSYNQIMKGVLEKMPAPEIREEQRVLGEAPKKQLSSKKSRKPAQLTEQDLLSLVGGDGNLSSSNSGNNMTSQNNTDLLMDILGGNSNTATSPSYQTTSQVSSSQAKSNVDIMSLFGNDSSSLSPAFSPSNVPSSNNNANDLLGISAGNNMSSTVPATTSPVPSGGTIQEAYNRNGLQISFQLQRSGQSIQAAARFKNVGSGGLKNVNLQAAVPKTQKLILQSISSSDITANGGEATQFLKVTGVNGPPPAKLRLRLRINYTLADGTSIGPEQVDWSEST